jgi:hypothetical protein
VEIEPLLSQIEALAPNFGRVTGDLQAVVSRDRSKDFKGVMQNTRLVLEAILRDLVTRELKQTPGKAMLDELISKFRQQTNAGLVPTNILAHMGTVQAWGNLSSHDHAGALSDEGVHVGEQEVAASLNSMVAILSWYAGKLGVALDATLVKAPTPLPATPQQPAATPLPQPPTQPQTQPPTQPAPPMSKGRAPLIAGGLGALVLLGGGFFIASRPSAPAPTPAPPAPSLAELDALYRTRAEPLPPAGCRAPNEAEAAYLQARKTYEADGIPGPELDRAVACSGFAAALALSGKTAVRKSERTEKDHVPELLAKAAREFDAAIAAEPSYRTARFNRAVVLLKRNHLDEGVHDLSALVQENPDDADAHFFLGFGFEAQKDKERATSEYCAAAKLGNALARNKCPQ